VDYGAKVFNGGLRVCPEETSINLAEDFPDGLGFIGEFDREGVFELDG
jgi:hypothetical protein